MTVQAAILGVEEAAIAAEILVGRARA